MIVVVCPPLFDLYTGFKIFDLFVPGYSFVRL